MENKNEVNRQESTEHQNTPSTSRVEKINAYSNMGNITIYQYDELSNTNTRHERCEKAHVWDWLRYKDGACPACEAKFSAAWDRKLKNLTAHIEGYLADCGIGKRHHRCTIDNFEGSRSVKKACQSISEKPGDTLLTGPPGTGKTHLLSGIVREMILNGLIFPLYHGEPRAIFKTVPDLFLELRATFGKNTSDSEDGIVGHLCSIPFLFLDDLGSERPSEWTTTTLYTIIDNRYREERPTFISTNLSLDEIANQLHPRIASRLSGGTIIRLTGMDYRTKRGNK